MEHFDIEIAGVKRQLPIIALNDELSIASFVILGDCQLVCQAAKALAPKIPQVDWLVTAEAKGIPLAHQLASEMGMERYIVVRKSVKPYMVEPLVDEVVSITTQKKQILCLDQEDAKVLAGKKVALVDDVVSTGESIAAIARLVEKAGGQVVAKVAIVTEGEEEHHKDVIALGKLPLFKKA